MHDQRFDVRRHHLGSRQRQHAVQILRGDLPTVELETEREDPAREAKGALAA
jgi:hypothetical protein